MHDFVKENLEAERGAKIWVKKLEGNGNRDVLTYIPEGVDLKAKNLRIIYHFHSTHSENISYSKATGETSVGWNRLEQTTKAVHQLAQAGENVILVYPQSDGIRHKPDDKNVGGKNYDRLWMAKGKIDREGKKVKDDFDQMHQEVLEELGISKDQIARVEAQGHSAGGLALTNIAESGTKLINCYRFLDASFEGWAERAHSASENNGKPDIFLLTSPPLMKDFPQSNLKKSSWGNKLYQRGDHGPYSTKVNRVYLLDSSTVHGNMPSQFTGWMPTNHSA